MLMKRLLLLMLGLAATLTVSAQTIVTGTVVDEASNLITAMDPTSLAMMTVTAGIRIS